MKPLPPLTREGNVKIEDVTRHPTEKDSFCVSFRLSTRERRQVVVSAEALFDFSAFRIAALLQANVYLRHEVEMPTPERQERWLDMIDQVMPEGDD